MNIMSKNLELRYVSHDSKANGETDFKGETSTFTTEQRVEFLNTYAKKLPKIFEDFSLDKQIVTLDEAREYMKSKIKPQPLPEIRNRIQLKNWKWTGCKEGKKKTKLSSNKTEISVQDFRAFIEWELTDNAVYADCTFTFGNAAEMGFDSEGQPYYISDKTKYYIQNTEKVQKIKLELDFVYRKWNLYLNDKFMDDFVAFSDTDAKEASFFTAPYSKDMDAYSLSLIKLGSGNNLIGYYMYHGGSNKIGKLSTLNEYHCRQWTKDCLTISYDFQAPLSEYGEAREHYDLLNMLHMFAVDFGESLALMEYVSAEFKPSRYDTSTLRYSMRTDGESGFVFVSHYQRLTELEDIHGAVIDTGTVKFPEIDVVGDICFFMPFNMDLSGVKLEYATTQPLCRVGDTYFFAAISGIKSEYKFADSEIFEVSAGADSVFCKNGIKIVTLTYDEARYARKLDSGLYIGMDCNVYEDNSEIVCVEDGSFSYLYWAGEAFEKHEVKSRYEKAVLSMEDLKNAPFELNPEYSRELHLNGERTLTWKKLSVNSAKGFVEINEVCDAAQIYADGILVADEFYYEVPWRMPASLLYGKECYLVMSEIRDDFYREF